MIPQRMLEEAIAEAKREMTTELAWCKCPDGCMCEHCGPLKRELALKQARERLAEAFKPSFEARFMEALEDYPLRNQTHTLSEKDLDAIIEELEAEANRE